MMIEFDRPAPGLPARPLREHALAAAIRAAEKVLATHGYPDPERAAEVLWVTLAEVYDEEDEAAEGPIQ